MNIFDHLLIKKKEVMNLAAEYRKAVEANNFEKGRDFHLEMAKLMLDKENISNEERNTAKSFNVFLL